MSFFFILQVAVDHKNIFQKALRQLPICFVFGMIFDVALWISAHVVPQNYIKQVLMAFAGQCLNRPWYRIHGVCPFGHFAAGRICVGCYESMGWLFWNTSHDG